MLIGFEEFGSTQANLGEQEDLSFMIKEQSGGKRIILMQLIIASFTFF